MKEILRKYLPKSVFFFLKKIRNPKLFKFNKPIYKKFNIEGIEFVLYLRDYRNTGDSILFLSNKIEGDVTSAILRETKEGDTFVDIGANIGYYTNLLGKKLSKGRGQVFAFEPVKKVYEQNLASIKKNNLKNTILYQKGCGEKKAQHEISINDNCVEVASLLNTQDKDTISRKEKVEIVKLDDFLKNKKIDLVKIDVEGYEYETLRGMRNIIKKYKPKIVMEFSPCFYRVIGAGRSLEILKFLVEAGYNIKYIQKNKNIKDINLFLEYLKKNQIGQVDLFCISNHPNNTSKLPNPSSPP